MDEELPRILDFNYKRFRLEEKGIGEFENFELFPEDIRRRILRENRESLFINKDYYYDELLMEKYYEDNCQDNPITMRDMIDYFKHLPVGKSVGISYFAASLTSLEGLTNGFLRVVRNADDTYTVSSYDIEHDPDVFEIVNDAKDIFNFMKDDGYYTLDKIDIFIPSVKVMREILAKRIKCVEYDIQRNIDYTSNFISNLIKTFISYFEEKPELILTLINFLGLKPHTKYPDYIDLVKNESFEELKLYYELFLTEELPSHLKIYPVSLFQ